MLKTNGNFCRVTATCNKRPSHSTATGFRLMCLPRLALPLSLPLSLPLPLSWPLSLAISRSVSCQLLCIIIIMQHRCNNNNNNNWRSLAAMLLPHKCRLQRKLMPVDVVAVATSSATASSSSAAAPTTVRYFSHGQVVSLYLLLLLLHFSLGNHRQVFPSSEFPLMTHRECSNVASAT